MANLPVFDMINSLGESLFHVGEMQKLKSLREHNEERAQEAHPDLLSMVKADDSRSKHQHRMEHHGSQFWTYYYQGESPDAVLANKPMQKHNYGTEEQKLAIESHMLDPEFAAYVPPEKENDSQAWLAKKRWTSYLWVGETALAKTRYEMAETAYRKALAELSNFEASKLEQSRTLSGLARALQGQAKHDEAEQFFLTVMDLEQHILGQGNANLEEEFYGIARYFIKRRRYEEVLDVYEDLLTGLLQTLGEADPMVARCLNEFGLVYFKQRRFRDAERVLAHAITILRQFDGLRDRQLAATMQNQAMVMKHLGRPEESQRLLRQAMSLLEEKAA